MTYKQNPAAFAATRTDSLIPALQRIARRLYFSAPSASPRDRAFLQEFASPEGRYQLVALQRLISCSRQSVKPEDREALPELIRGEILSGVPLEFNIAMAFDAETFAQGEADNAQRLYERRLCAASRDVAIEKLTVHHAALRASLDAVLANRI